MSSASTCIHCILLRQSCSFRLSAFIPSLRLIRCRPLHLNPVAGLLVVLLAGALSSFPMFKPPNFLWIPTDSNICSASIIIIRYLISPRNSYNTWNCHDVYLFPVFSFFLPTLYVSAAYDSLTTALCLVFYLLHPAVTHFLKSITGRTFLSLLLPRNPRT